MRRRLTSLPPLLVALVACPAPPPAEPTLELAVVDGALELRRGELVLGAVSAWLALDGARVELATCAPRFSTTEQAVSLRGRCGAVEVELAVAARDGELAVVEVALHSEASPAPRFGGLGLHGLVRGPGRPRGTYMEGFGSWNAANFVVVEEASDIERVARTGDNDDYVASDGRVSWWVSALAYEGAGLVSGALRAERLKTRVLTFFEAGGARDAVRWELRVGDTGDALPVGDAAAPLVVEPLFVGLFDDAAAGLDRYGREVAAANGVRAPPSQPLGWNSWNTHFADIDAATILAAAQAARAELPDLALNNLQIDDGWERAWGDWEASDRFPDGMAALAAQLAALGFTPGLWWAPFLVDETLPLVQAEPAWFLHDAQGAPRVYQTTGEVRRYRVLDVTHPGARQFVLDSFDRFVGWGYRYLKSDFLFAGAFEGARHDPDASALMAYRDLFAELARRADAAGVYLLACGAPLLPSAGLFHAIRTGEDIAAAHGGYGLLYNKNAFRNVAYRAYVNRFLVSDPDTALLRELSPGVQRINLSADLLAGAIFNLGDDLTALDGERLQRLRSLGALPVADALLAGGPRGVLRPLDLFAARDQAFATKFEYFLTPEAYSVPAQWLLELGDGRRLLALFAWDEAAVHVDLDLATLRGDAGAPVRELWSGRQLPLDGGRLRVEVPAADALLLLL